MLIRLSEMSPLPLREQIVRRIRELVLSGELPEHYRLPSIRGLAQEQRVGAVTVQRAYEDLEREKVIYSRQGKGFFVAPLADDDRREHADGRVAENLLAPVLEARRLGVPDARILEIVRDILAAAPDATGREGSRKED